MNGFEFLQEAKKLKVLGSTPIVVLTTSNNEDDKCRCRQLGAKLFLNKENCMVGMKKQLKTALAIITEQDKSK